MGTHQHAVPVSLGTARLTMVEATGFRITHATFPPGLVLDRHVHDRDCLTIVIDGAFAETFRDGVRECSASSLLAKPAGEPHADRFARMGSRQLIIEPAPDRLTGGCLSAFDGITCVRREVREIARRGVREIHHGDALSGLALESIALELIVLLGRAAESSAVRLPPWLARVRDLVHDGFRHTLTMDQLAREAGVHPGHLAREFRRHLGVSPAEYRRRLQTEWVAARLRETDEPIAAIAARAGFFDQSHLTNAFRRAFGVTPGVYRREQGGSPNARPVRPPVRAIARRRPTSR